MAADINASRELRSTLEPQLEILKGLAQEKFAGQAPAIAAMFADIVREMEAAAAADDSPIVPGLTNAVETLTRRLRLLTTSIDVVTIGTGQYNTGDAPKTEQMSTNISDKGRGVIHPSLCFLRQQGLVRTIGIAGTRQDYFPLITDYVQQKVGTELGLDPTFEAFPKEGRDPHAYLAALQSIQPSAAIIVTPDDTHFEIARACITRGVHVLVVKPLVQTMKHHEELLALAEAHGVLVQVEYHKQFDPAFQNAANIMRDQLNQGGKFVDWYSRISQPFTQLAAFEWAGTGSDINYYLNSHFMYFLSRALEGHARPTLVTAHAAHGSSRGKGVHVPDMISVTATWQQFKTGEHTPVIDPDHQGTAVFNASWVDEVGANHTQQHFRTKVGTKDIRVDQGDRGISVVSDGALKNINPFYMDFTRNDDGSLNFQGRYGFESVDKFIRNVIDIKNGTRKAKDFYRYGSDVPNVWNTWQTTVLLEAATCSWKNRGVPVEILYNGKDACRPTGWKPLGN